MANASKRGLEDKHQKILRQLLTLPENKKCMDCKEKGPFYACTTFGTFVCPTCSGIHREFGHRVKSISLATFTSEEVKFLQEMGNGNARAIWLAHWTPADYSEPDSTDKDKIREFMKKKYVQKQWHISNDGSPRKERKQSKVDVPKPEPLEKILGKEIPPIQITHNVNVNVSSGQRKKDKSPKQTTKPKESLLVWDEPPPAIPVLAPASVPVVTSTTVSTDRNVLTGLESIFATPLQQEAPKPSAQSITWPPSQTSIPPLPQISAEGTRQLHYK